MSPRVKGQLWPKEPREQRKQFHVAVDEAVRRRINVVASDAGVTASELFREIFISEIDRRYRALVKPRQARGGAGEKPRAKAAAD